MEYAFLNFDDEIKVNILGVGLVPAITLYPELWELQLKKFKLQLAYLDELIKGLQGFKNQAKGIDEALKKLDLELKEKALSLGIPPIICALKIGVNKDNAVIKNLITNEIFYVNNETFKNNMINKFDKRVGVI